MICGQIGWNFRSIFPKRTKLFPLKDYKGHLVKKSSFKGHFEIKDACTYTAFLARRAKERECPQNCLCLAPPVVLVARSLAPPSFLRPVRRRPRWRGWTSISKKLLLARPGKVRCKSFLQLFSARRDDYLPRKKENYDGTRVQKDNCMTLCLNSVVCDSPDSWFINNRALHT